MLGLVPAFLLSLRLQKVISEPILKLREAMGTVSRQRDYSIRVAQSRDDELGALITGFNDMLAQSQARDAELARYSAQLEDEVSSSNLQLEAVKERRIQWLENLARFLRHGLKNKTIGIKTSLDPIDRRRGNDAVVKYIVRARASIDFMQQLLDSVGNASTMEASFYRDEKAPRISNGSTGLNW